MVGGLLVLYLLVIVFTILAGICLCATGCPSGLNLKPGLFDLGLSIVSC